MQLPAASADLSLIVRYQVHSTVAPSGYVSQCPKSMIAVVCIEAYCQEVQACNKAVEILQEIVVVSVQ